MARPREKLDLLKHGTSLQKQLKEEPPGWRRERLLAVQTGLAGGQSLARIAAAVGHARSIIRQWFGRFRKGGVELLLGDGRAEDPGAEGLLTGEARAQFGAGRGKAARLTAPQIRGWLAKEHGIRAALPTIYKWLGKADARLPRQEKMAGLSTMNFGRLTLPAESPRYPFYESRDDVPPYHSRRLNDIRRALFAFRRPSGTSKLEQWLKSNVPSIPAK